MKLLYPAIFYPADEGGYTVEIPDLLGCVTEGDTLEEAMDMGVDAASGWILGEWESGNSVPTPSNIKEVVPDLAEGFVSLLSLDMDNYAERYGAKSVRKNLTIPAWLNTFAEANNISFSQVLQDVLSSMASGKQ